MNPKNIEILEEAKIGIENYLNNAYKSGNIDEQLYTIAKNNTYSNLVRWFGDEILIRLAQILEPA